MRHWLYVFLFQACTDNMSLLLQKIKQYKPSVLLTGSHHYVQLSEYDLNKAFKEENIKSSDLNSVKAVVPTGSAVPSCCMHEVKKRFQLSVLHLDGYGQTECSAIAGRTQELVGLGSIYKGVTVKVKCLNV